MKSSDVLQAQRIAKALAQAKLAYIKRVILKKS